MVSYKNVTMKTIQLLSILIFIPSFLFAQNKTGSTGFAVHDVSAMAGFVFQTNTSGTIEDFRKLNPQSTLLNNDFSAYKQRGSNAPVIGAGTILVGFRFNEKASPVLRLGVSYWAGNSLVHELNNTEQHTFDTLVSVQTGQTLYLDSSIYHNYTMKYFTESMRFDASLIFRAKLVSILSMYAGIGFTVGYTVNTKTNIDYTFNPYTYIRYPDDSYGNYHSTYSSRDENNVKEKIRNKNELCYSGYIPLGIDLGLGRRRKFLSKVHFFSELRGGLNFQKIPEIGSYTHSFLQLGFGMRVTAN